MFKDLISQGFSRAAAKELVNPANPAFSVGVDSAVKLQHRRNWDGSFPFYPLEGDLPPVVYMAMLRDALKTTAAVLEIYGDLHPLDAAKAVAEHLNHGDQLFALLFPVAEVIEHVNAGLEKMRGKEDI